MNNWLGATRFRKTNVAPALTPTFVPVVQQDGQRIWLGFGQLAGGDVEVVPSDGGASFGMQVATGVHFSLDSDGPICMQQWFARSPGGLGAVTVYELLQDHPPCLDSGFVAGPYPVRQDSKDAIAKSVAQQLGELPLLKSFESMIGA